MLEILTVGQELTSGTTVDKNAGFIAHALHSIGLSTSRITTVGDAIEDIVRALKSVLPETRFIIITGGLGPTEDDRTAQAAAKTFGRELIVNKEALDCLEQKFKQSGRKIFSAERKQAMLPTGCRIVQNPVGTACGFLIEEGKRHFVFLPGVPEEVRAITDKFLVGHLKEAVGSKQIIFNRTLKVFGLWESAIQQKLDGILPANSTASIGFYPQYPEVRLRITGKGLDAAQVQKDMNRLQDIIYERIGEYIYSDSDEPLEAVVGNLLKKNNATLAVAESCTGGLISHLLTNVSGSSQYLERSLVVYSNRAKEQLLKVKPEDLDEFGAVSEPVARAMAQGVREFSGTTYGLGVTGIAGPTGGTPQKPVGTVFIAISSAAVTEVKSYRFYGGREKIKIMSSHTALNLLRSILAG